jgi:hypothetical protein
MAPVPTRSVALVEDTNLESFDICLLPDRKELTSDPRILKRGMYRAASSTTHMLPALQSLKSCSCPSQVSEVFEALTTFMEI